MASPTESGTVDRAQQGAAWVAFLAALLLIGFAAVHVHWVGRNEQLIKFDVVHHLDEFADYHVTAGAIRDHVEGVGRRLGERIKLLNVRAGQHLMWPRLMYALGSVWTTSAGGGIKGPLQANLL
ncbi:MAG: hypothetical protein QGH45_03645, partial [Myxococcota bacterium]|nr:hypothetical protein [Myxococcota bacterium]